MVRMAVPQANQFNSPRAPQPELPDAHELIARYYDKIFNLAFRTLGRREDAEDIAQQTFLRALPRLGDLCTPGAAGAWLYRIATNLCLDLVRGRQMGTIPLDDDILECAFVPDPDRLTTPAQAAELREERLAVWRAALGLPPEQRLALALRELHAMSYAQIAESMGKSISAVETLLFRARVGFRRAFDEAPVQITSADACASILELLSASIDGELAAREQACIDAHVPTCRTCQFASCELRATSRMYALIPVLSPAAGKLTAASLLGLAGTSMPTLLTGRASSSAVAFEAKEPVR
jgi:RNA polymerase sigma-70 factor (ECF subfamily)